MHRDASELIELLIEGIDSIEDRDANNFFNGRAMILLGDIAPFCTDHIVNLLIFVVLEWS